MYFLHTIEEGNESEALLQESQKGGQKESDEPLPHGIGKSRHETDSSSYKATTGYSEKEPVSPDKRGDRNYRVGLAPVVLKELSKPHDEPNKSLSSPSPRSSSAARSANRRSFSTPQSSRRMSSSAPGGSQRRTTSALGSPSSSAPHEALRRSSTRRAQETTSWGTTGKKDPSTKRRRAARRRRRHVHPTAEHDDLPAPQWVINLMFDIEEATRHELTVEHK